MARIDGDKVEHWEVSEVTFDRPRRIMWNRWGEPHEVPIDPVSLLDWVSQGWTMHEPLHPEERPRAKKMRDGSIFEYSQGAADPTPAEKRRMVEGRDRAAGTPAAPASPVATYYSPQGDKFENWPADPASVKQYLELGFSLTPPAKTTRRRTQLKVVESA